MKRCVRLFPWTLGHFVSNRWLSSHIYMTDNITSGAYVGRMWQLPLDGRGFRPGNSLFLPIINLDAIEHVFCKWNILVVGGVFSGNATVSPYSRVSFALYLINRWLSGKLLIMMFMRMRLLHMQTVKNATNLACLLPNWILDSKIDWRLYQNGFS